MERVEKAAFAIGRTTRFRVTPKLDGMAGIEGGILASRGNGLVGNDITHVFNRGIVNGVEVWAPAKSMVFLL